MEQERFESLHRHLAERECPACLCKNYRHMEPLHFKEAKSHWLPHCSLQGKIQGTEKELQAAEGGQEPFPPTFGPYLRDDGQCLGPMWSAAIQ